MRQAGWIVTTPLQARARADVVLLVGGDLDADWPGLEARLLLGQPPSLYPDVPRPAAAPGRRGRAEARDLPELPRCDAAGGAGGAPVAACRRA